MDDRALVMGMVAFIEKNLVNALDSNALVVKSGYSLNRLRQKFFNILGDTPSGYIRKRRLTEASKEILAGTSIVDIALKYGYSSQDNFTTAFRSYFGLTPKELYHLENKYKKFLGKLREVYNIMELTELKQPSLCSTLMGCIKGSADYFDLDLSVPMLYGLSGHAFMINIHKELCPSGPYVWKKDRFYQLLNRIGIKQKEEYWISRDSSKSEKAKIEDDLKKSLNEGNLGILNFLEHQLIGGYDEQGFVFLQPWSGAGESELKKLTFNTWDECLSREPWVGFQIIGRSENSDRLLDVAADALKYVLEIYRTPEKFQEKDYRVGYGAYEYWIDCINRGMGNSHGNWWNGKVWTECRQFAALFFGELREIVGDESAMKKCETLKQTYDDIAVRMNKASDKNLDDAKKIELLRECIELEKTAEKGIDTLLKVLLK
ncbi:MAG: helix-turn-helix transcriptional regulator [Spirochaetales bacterium]|nr:helix-turn-helix transcriptional regulator [Spirochaetales bacterium]